MVLGLSKKFKKSKQVVGSNFTRLKQASRLFDASILSQQVWQLTQGLWLCYWLFAWEFSRQLYIFKSVSQPENGGRHMYIIIKINLLQT